jgi:hypothetical protein
LRGSLIPASRRIQDGQPVIVWASVEDPTRPDVIHHRIIRADDFQQANSEAGFNEQQVCWAIIVFMFAYWEDEVRPKLAAIRGVAKNNIQFDALGDLRVFRNAIVHHKGIMTSADHASLKTLASLSEPNGKISLTHDQMHKLFIEVKKAIGDLVLHYTGHLPGAPKPGEIVDVAIQNVR